MAFRDARQRIVLCRAVRYYVSAGAEHSRLMDGVFIPQQYFDNIGKEGSRREVMIVTRRALEVRCKKQGIYAQFKIMFMEGLRGASRC